MPIRCERSKLRTVRQPSEQDDVVLSVTVDVAYGDLGSADSRGTVGMERRERCTRLYVHHPQLNAPGGARGCDQLRAGAADDVCGRDRRSSNRFVTECLERPGGTAAA